MELKSLFMVFISIVVGIALASALGPMLWENTNNYDITDESVNVSTDRCTENGANFSGITTFTLEHTDDIDTLLLVEFDNGTVLTEDTDFTFDITAGTFVMINSTTTESHVTSNITLWTYRADNANYVSHATSRTILSTLVMLFFVIGILAIGVGWVYKKYHEF